MEDEDIEDPTAEPELTLEERVAALEKTFGTLFELKTGRPGMQGPQGLKGACDCAEKVADLERRVAHLERFQDPLGLAASALGNVGS